MSHIETELAELPQNAVNLHFFYSAASLVWHFFSALLGRILLCRNDAPSTTHLLRNSVQSVGEALLVLSALKKEFEEVRAGSSMFFSLTFRLSFMKKNISMKRSTLTIRHLVVFRQIKSA